MKRTKATRGEERKHVCAVKREHAHWSNERAYISN